MGLLASIYVDDDSGYMSMTIVVEDEQPKRYDSILQIVMNSSYNNNKQCSKSVFLPGVGIT
jgi:hypothetical protein